MPATRVGLTAAFAAILLAAPERVAHAQWSAVAGVPASDVYGLAVVGDTLLAGGDGVVRVSVDGGATWSASAPLGDGAASGEAIWLRGGRLFVGTYGQGIFTSTDLGQTWQPAGNGLEGGFADTHLYITALESRGDSLFAATDGAGVYRTSLVGPVQWVHMAEPFSSHVASGVRDIERGGGGRLVAGAGGNGLVFRHDEGDAAWAPDSLPAPRVGLQVADLAWNGERWSAATQRGLYQSSTGEGGWVAVGPSLSGVSDSRVTPVGTTLFWAGNRFSDCRFAVRPGGTGDWQLLESLPTYVYRLATHAGTLLAARSDGLWRRDLSSLDAPAPAPRAALALRASTPMRRGGRLRLSVPSSASLQLDVLDLQGRRVARWFEGTLPAGEHDLEVEAGDLAPGLYLARVRAGGEAAVSRFVRLD